MADKQSDRLLEIVSGLVEPFHPERLLHQCRAPFKGVDLADKDLLEIGAGAGTMSAYAAVHGARRVVAIEPEAAGSTEGFVSSIRQIAQKIPDGIMTVRAATLQEYSPPNEKFGVVLLHNSVNHLEEADCMELHRDAGARQRYTELFEKIASMMRPGGLLLLSDCSRHNLYDKIGMANPIAPDIEWNKHQPPGLWMKLLRPLGFEKVRIRWHRPYRLKRLGPLVGNAFANFFLTSHFHLCLRLRRD